MILLIWLIAFVGLNLRLTKGVECIQEPRLCTELINGVNFCNDEAKVRADRLSIEGTISREIGNFVSTSSVNFIGNILTGRIPTEIGLMKSLTGIGLGKNYLTGDIPEELYQLSNLGWLNFGDLPLSGNLSSSIGNFEHVSSFELYETNIRGTIPTEIGRMKQVIWLFMHGNDLSGTIPREISTLPNLAELRLKGNKNLCNPGIVFGEGITSDLNEVPLCPGTSYGAPITRIKEESPNKVTDSSCLYTECADGFSCNENTGYCEMQEIFGGKYPQNTRKISAVNCGLAGGIPKKLCELKNLEVLDLKQNGVIGEIPDCIFDLKNLQFLSLSMNKIDGTLPSLIGRLTKLTHLDISQTKIYGQIPTEVGKLAELTHLDMSKMKLTGTLVSEIGNLLSLEYFSMNGNKKFGKGENGIGSGEIDILPRQIGNFTRLTHLDVSDLNFDGNIPSQLGKLQNLTHLNIGGSFNSRLPSQLGGLQKLTFLNIKHNIIQAPLPTQLGKLQNLVELHARESMINGKIPTEFGALQNLRMAGLENNRITGTLPSEIGFMSNLRRFSIIGNSLNEKLPSQIGRLSSLKYFDIRDNRFSKPLPSELGLLRSLRLLLLGNNRFSGKLPTELGNLDLFQIDLSENDGISGTLPKQFGRLEHLKGAFEISGKLNGTIPSTFGNLLQLDTLDLSSNLLTGEIPSDLGKMKALRVLSLRNNSLEGGISTSLFNLNSLMKLEIGLNPLKLVCDCKLLSWFSDFVSTLDQYDSADVIGCSPDNDYHSLAIHTLRSDQHAPCSHATFTPVQSAGTTSVTVNWKYSSWTNSESYAMTFETIRSEKMKNNSMVLATNFSQHVEPCEAFSIDESLIKDQYRKFGFEITANAGSIRKCILAENINIGPNEFSYTIDNLNPYQRYDVSVRAIFLEKGQLKNNKQEISFLYGPRSVTLYQETLPSIPGIPQAVLSPQASDRLLMIQWEKPLRPNGRITQYRVKLENKDGETIKLHSTRDTSLGNSEALTWTTIQGMELNPNSLYNVSVCAKNVAGWGKYSNPIEVTTCPDNMRRDDLGECFSTVGYFKASPMNSMDCSGVSDFIKTDSCLIEGLTMETLKIKEGYWRESLESIDVKPCPDANFCQQSSPEVNSSDKYCTTRHTGVYCQTCLTPFTMVFGEGCIECTEDDIAEDESIIVAYFLVLVLVPVSMIVYLLRKSKTRKNRQGKAKQKKASSFRGMVSMVSKGSTLLIFKEIFGTKLRILFGFFQVFLGFTNTFLYKAIDPSTRNRLSYIFNINPGQLLASLSVDCAFNASHYDTLLIYTLYPICVGLLMKVVEIIVRKYFSGSFDLPYYLQKTKILCLGIMFCIYPGVSYAIFATFDCEHFDLADGVKVYRSALRVDYQLECGVDAQRIFMLAFATMMIFVYPVGILIVYSLVLGVFSERRSSKLEEISRYLTYPYKRDMYWFELFELFRKLMQNTLALALFSINEGIYGLDILGSLAGAIVFLLLVIKFDAYREFLDAWYAVISLLMLIALCMLAIAAKLSPENIDINMGILGITVTEVLLYVIFCALSAWMKLSVLNNKAESDEGLDVTCSREKRGTVHGELNEIIEEFNQELDQAKTGENTVLSESRTNDILINEMSTNAQEVLEHHTQNEAQEKPEDIGGRVTVS